MSSIRPTVSDGISSVIASAADGRQLHGLVRSIGRYSALLELFDPTMVVRASEVLDPCVISFRGVEAYRGRAVVASVQSHGSSLLCEVSLEEKEFATGTGNFSDVDAAYEEFSAWWSKTYQVRPDYKVAVADLQTYLQDLRLWLDGLDSELAMMEGGSGEERRREIVDGVARRAIPVLTELFERCERISGSLGESERPAHRSFARRQIHPLVLCAPFCHRTYLKPLGYAGDYEMVNMISGDPHIGRSSYARVINCWFLAQAPAEAHRRRLIYLESRLRDEAVSAWLGGRTLRVLNIGCGPCIEIQRFLKGWTQWSAVEFTLVDFNEQTLVAAQSALAPYSLPGGRGARIEYVRRSVMQLLAGGGRWPGSEGRRYDFVYCAGLTDYLTDAVCRRLIEQLFGMVAPGGLLVVTNVDRSNPRIETMEQILDWHLMYRSGAELMALAPKGAGVDSCRVLADATGVNDYLEVRRLDAE